MSLIFSPRAKLIFQAPLLMYGFLANTFESFHAGSLNFMII
jgi:hypothetical protein